MSESAVELEQRAERAVRRGELFAALELFEQLLAMEPDDELLRERLEELRELVAPGAPADLAAAEPIPAPAPRHTPARPASRSHKLAHASFAPIDDRPAAPLSKDPVKMLETLLDRVR